jgi:hypothetical protein
VSQPVDCPGVLPTIGNIQRTLLRKVMTCTELWLTYVQTSRGDKPHTAQLIDLNVKGRKMCDLEDLLQHVFDSGYLDPKYRPVSWWERCDGSKVKGSLSLEDIVHEGTGVCETTALRLVIGEQII